jgi:hypothetical protein
MWRAARLEPLVFSCYALLTFLEPLLGAVTAPSRSDRSQGARRPHATKGARRIRAGYLRETCAATLRISATYDTWALT